jgi:hypothetical protein
LYSFIHKAAFGLMILAGVLAIVTGMRFSKYLPAKGSPVWLGLTAVAIAIAFSIYSSLFGRESFLLWIFFLTLVLPLVIAGFAGFRGQKGYFVFTVVSLITGISCSNYIDNMVTKGGSGGLHDFSLVFVFVMIAVLSMVLGIVGQSIAGSSRQPG